MPELTINLNGTTCRTPVERLTRAKLYGFTVIEATDRDGKRCQPMKLADDGRTLIGESKLMRMTEDGRNCEKPAYIDGDGQVLPVVPSSFDAPVTMQDATVEEFLNHRIVAVYALSTLVHSLFTPGYIVKFPFTYRAGVNVKTGFIVGTAQGAFLCVGEPLNVVLLGLDDQPPPQTDEVDTEEIDFSEM